MALTRADIRGHIRQQVDPATATLTNGDLDDIIEECVLQVSSLLPIRQTFSDTVTGTTATLTGRARFIESVDVAGTYWDPLHQAEQAFASGYYHAETLTDTTLITFGASLSSASVTIVYYADTTQTDTDGSDFALPDQHAPVIILLALAWANTALFMQELADATDLAIVSRLLSTADDLWDEYFAALATAVAEWEIAADEIFELL
jgi:hypothetical protein